MNGVVSLLTIDLIVYCLMNHLSTTFPFLRSARFYSERVLYWIKIVYYSLTTTIVFAINQLSPSSISISPLIIIHLRILLHPQVRSIYLMIIRSLGFGSINLNF